MSLKKKCILEGALSIEVWGHRSAGFSRAKPGWEVEQQLAKARSLIDRWSELTRKIELWVEIQELNDMGEYAPVEVSIKPDMLTGGIYQLRQGQQRRIQVRVKPVQNSGTLPIICQSIVKIEVGSVLLRSRLQRQLDSYQEEDLTVLREKWSDALTRRRQYLDQQIKKIIDKPDKTEQDAERESSLMDQWVSLTEERNAVWVPTPGSSIPGAPAVWNPPPGMEPYVPVLFLDLNGKNYIKFVFDTSRCRRKSRIIFVTQKKFFFVIIYFKSYKKCLFFSGRHVNTPVGRRSYSNRPQFDLTKRSGK